MPAFQLILSLGLLPFAGKVILQFFTSQIGVSGAPGPRQAQQGSTRWRLSLASEAKQHHVIPVLFEVDPEPPSPVCVRLDLSILIPIKLACSFANPIYLFSHPSVSTCSVWN